MATTAVLNVYFNGRNSVNIADRETKNEAHLTQGLEMTSGNSVDYNQQRANHVAYRLVILSFCQFVILSAILGLNISETRPDSGMVPMDSL